MINLTDSFILDSIYFSLLCFVHSLQEKRFHNVSAGAMCTFPQKGFKCFLVQGLTPDFKPLLHYFIFTCRLHCILCLSIQNLKLIYFISCLVSVNCTSLCYNNNY